MASMAGSFERGGRYNVRDYFGCLYTCLDRHTLDLELARYYTVPPDCGFAEAAIAVQLTSVLDLTSQSILKSLGLPTKMLIDQSYTFTQHAGACAWEAGIEGLIVPSAADPAKRNLALLLDNQKPGWLIGVRSVSTSS